MDLEADAICAVHVIVRRMAIAMLIARVRIDIWVLNPQDIARWSWRHPRRLEETVACVTVAV